MVTAGRAHLLALLALLALGAGGCSGPPGGPAPTLTAGSTAPSPSTGWGTRYALPARMCDTADLTALTELYPHENLDSVLRVNSSRACHTTIDAGARRLAVSVEVYLTDATLLDIDPTLTRQWYDDRRASARGLPTDLAGVGSAAFWFGDEYELVLETYDGNLAMELSVHAVDRSHPLASDMLQRVAAVAVGTLASLAT
jgi:hypothetical protein